MESTINSTISETAIFIDPEILNEGHLPVGKFKMVLGDPNATTTFLMSWENLGRGMRNIQHTKRNEELLLLALRNNIRKINFLELNEDLEEGDISDEYYNNELEKNSDKYAITLKNIDNPNDIINIVELVDKIGQNLRSFSMSEVSEMFSVNESSLLGHLRTEIHKVK